VASFLLLSTFILLMFPPVIASLLLLASPAVPVVSCVDVGPAVDVFLPMLFRPCYCCLLYSSVTDSKVPGCPACCCCFAAFADVPAVAGGLVNVVY
jgi:hypothetical protein